MRVEIYINQEMFSIFSLLKVSHIPVTDKHIVTITHVNKLEFFIQHTDTSGVADRVESCFVNCPLP